MSLPNAVLGILSYMPMTGYDLGKVFSKSINYSWTASLSQIYRELDTLEKKGFVVSEIEAQEDRPDRRVYSITESGKEAFHTWLTNFPETFTSPKRDDFSLRIFFGSQVGDRELIRQLDRFIKEREDFEMGMEEGKKLAGAFLKQKGTADIMEKIQQEERYIRFILKRARLSNQALIQWAKECIEELEQGLVE